MSTVRDGVEEPLPLQPGEVFADRFAIVSTAGSGGMGTVYRAHDTLTGQAVALKLLHPQSATHHPERFAREAQLLSELRHPNIVSYVAHGQSPQGQPFLAMEWLDGHDLAQHLTRGPLPIATALHLTSQIATALSLAHQHGIVHRDATRKNKICSLAGHKATHRRRTDHAHALFTHSPH